MRHKWIVAGQRKESRTITSENKTDTTANPIQDNKPMRLTKKIGSTTYKVSVHFSRTSKETVDDKIIRMIQNEAVRK